jgi:hypothetical protein
MTQFERNLFAVLAHSLLYEANLYYSPNGIVDDARAEDPSAPKPSESVDEIMRAFGKYLPDFLNTEMGWMQPMEQATFATSKEFSPKWAKLQSKLYNQYAPKLAETSQQIDAANKMAGAQGDLAVLQGPGAQSVDAVTEMLRKTDPEFFSTRQLTAQKIDELLGSGLTPAEEEAVSRRLSRERVDSGISVPTSTNTVSEAMQFGDAARKRTLEGVAAANSFLPASRTGFDPTQVALGRPSINTGDSKFMGVQQPANVKGESENFFNTTAGLQGAAMQVNAQKRDWIDKTNEAIGSVNV